jgi:hypothetical protein
MSICFMSMHQVYVHAAHHRCVCVCECVIVFVCLFMCVFVCINAGMPNCPASDQSGTGLKKTNDAGTGPVLDQAKTVWHFFGPVPGWNYWCRNADAGVSFLDADAQLWYLVWATLNNEGFFSETWTMRSVLWGWRVSFPNIKNYIVTLIYLLYSIQRFN